MISGEPGAGKSSLLRGLRVDALRRGIVVGWDRCPESAAAAPYRSWRTAVATLVPDDDLHAGHPAPQDEAAGTLLATHLGALDRLGARTEPAVMVIDDLQWADDATLSLLAFLAPELERLRILLAVGVRRTGPLVPAVRDCLAELARTTDPVHLTLTGLAPDAIAAWVTALTGRDAAPAVVAQLADVTGGNPFYVRELLALLAADGRLDGDSDAVPGLPSGIPHAVQDVVRRRTSRLPPDTQGVLTTAAVIGRRFDLDVLAGVVELDVAEALRRLEPALDDGLVEVDDRRAGRFAFSHALVSGTLAAELNAARLAAVHARTTDVIERLRAGDLEPWVEDLAYHASEGLVAGTAPQALAYARRAAASAEAVQSSADVAVQLQRAVAAAALVPELPVAERRDLLVRLGMAWRETGAPDARPTLVEAARLAEADDDPHALAAILGDLDADSLWAGYDWDLHDPHVVAAVERALARPDLSRPRPDAC